MQKDDKMKILFLSSWYPNRYDAMEGLFVRKHAEAASRIANVTVLYVKNFTGDSFEIEEEKFKDVREIYIYYPESNTPFLKKVVKTLNWLRAYWKGFQLIRKEGLPDLIHTNILTRTAIIALLIKWFYGIPYVITEHWSRYLKIRNGYNGWLRKRATELAVANAKAILPVSVTLQNAMIENGLNHANYQIVNNVVDDFFFQQELCNEKHERTQFLHISCFCEEAKNVKGILEAVKILKERRNDFELTIIGTGVDFQEVYDYAKSLNVIDSVHFLGEKTPEEVMTQFQHSDVFLLNSNFETSGVVIMESLASGKPVITTAVGIAPQVIHPDNGLLVPFRQPEALAEKMDWMISHHHEYDAQKIRKEAYIFSYDTISKQLGEIYKQAKGSSI